MCAGGVRLLVELASMAHLQSQAISLGGGGPALLMDHAQADMDAVASWWYYEGEAPRAAPTAAEGRSSPELGGKCPPALKSPHVFLPPFHLFQKPQLLNCCSIYVCFVCF